MTISRWVPTTTMVPARVVDGTRQAVTDKVPMMPWAYESAATVCDRVGLLCNALAQFAVRLVALAEVLCNTPVPS